MALEDFFTLTEMEDGLVAVVRVQELMSILGRQKHCTVSGISDESRECPIVSRVLAATRNNNCLDHFIRLGGLWFLNRWLMYSYDAAGGPVEKTISLILGALERLPLTSRKYKKKFVSSGIGRTMKHLLVIDDSNIQESARLLLDKWDVMSDDSQDEEKHLACHNNEPKEDIKMNKDVSSDCRFSDDFYKGENGEVSFSPKSVNDDKCKRISAQDATKNVEDLVRNDSILYMMFSSGGGVTTPDLPKPCQKNSSASDESLNCHGASIGVPKCKFPSAVDKNADFQSQPTQSDDDCFISNYNGVEEEDVHQCQHGICILSSCSGHSFPTLVQNPSTETFQVRSLYCKDDESALEKTTAHRVNSVVFGSESLEQDKTSKELNVLVLEEDVTVGKLEDLDSSSCEKEVQETCRKKKEMRCSLQDSKKAHSGSKHGLLKSGKEADIYSESKRTKPENENGKNDEARVIHADRERDNSSVEGNSDNELEDGSSSGLRRNRSSKPDTSPEIDHSYEDSCTQEERLKAFENTDVNSRNPCNQENARPSVQEFEHSNGRSRCSFDLNENVCTDDFDYLPASMINHRKILSVPVAVIATSKGAPALLFSPFRFGGESGWRGSAATSAFRTASPRRTPDGENIASGLREKANFIKIDLNLTKDDSEEVDNPILEKQILDSLLLPSGESSVEITSAKAERLKFDLNHTSDENILMNSSPCGKCHHSDRNGSLSPTSSSSTKQPSMKDIDLNDHPNFIDSCGSNSLNGYLIDADGRGRFMQDASVDIRVSTPMLSYPHAPSAGYVHNEPAKGQPFAHSRGMYGPGPFPHMVNSRGVAPQLIGSLAASNVSASSTQPFLVKATGSQSLISQPRTDLNTTILTLDGGESKDSRSLNQQLFMEDRGAMMDRQVGTVSHPVSGSSAGLKRKCPDGGWENFPVGSNRGTSWQ